MTRVILYGAPAAVLSQGDVPGHDLIRLAYEDGSTDPDDWVRGQVCFATPPVMVWGVEVNGFSSGTGGTATAWVRDDLDDAVTERLVVHEWLHSLGGDRLHEDPRWWTPALDSAEARASCALQGRLCDD